MKRTAAWRRVVLVVLYVWRRLMIRTTVIAITGSVGKTTAKEALATILSAHGRTLKTSFNENDDLGVPKTLKALRPWHRFAVIEIGTGAPGMVRRSARLVRPDVAVVLRVARNHTNVFRDLESTAREKASLLEYLPRRGLAVLNADDGRVRAMQALTPARTVLFGSGKESEVRVLDASSVWPQRLSLKVRAGEEEVDVHTNLVGCHWVPSLLAALAAARACGVPLIQSAAALEDLVPFNARMQPVTLPNGAVVLRDEANGAPDPLEAMLTVMREARASRRVLVFSDLSDSRDSPRRRLRKMGRLAAELTDLAVFTGGHAHHAVTAAVKAGMDPAQCHDIVDLKDAAELLRQELRKGDLVFLKGRATDHLSRILFAQFGDIGCWTVACSIRRPCEFCPRLKPGFDMDAALRPAPAVAS